MRIRLFGDLSVVSGDGLPVRFSTRKTALLFAALVLVGPKGARRESLAEMLWPDRAEAQARSSLRQALVDIRHAFPTDASAPIQVEGRQEWIALALPDTEVDIRVFETLAGEEAPARLADAAALYRGDLLGDIGLTADAGTWLAPYRADYRHKALQLVERFSLASALLDPAQELACKELAERLISNDSASEEAHRALIRIHLGHGHTNAALRQYHVCRDALMGELGVEPEPGTRRLVERGGEAGEIAVLPAPAAPSIQAPTFPLPQRPSIVVLPFQNMSADPLEDYFVDGIVEEITTSLSRMGGLFVIARNSAFTYKNRSVDVRQIGQELGVRYVLEGSLRRAGPRLRVAGQLVDATSGVTLWADRFDGEIEDIFVLQDRIAADVTGAVAPKLEQAEIERAKRKASKNLDAYDHFLRGMADVYSWSRPGIERALPHFYKAMELDGDFARAGGAAAWCYFWRMANGWMDDRSRETAEVLRLVDRVAQIGSDDADALAMSGLALGYVVGDYRMGVVAADRAVLLNPNLAAGWSASGCMRACHDDPDIAIEHLARARRLSPLDPLAFFIQSFTAFAHFVAGRYEQAWPLADAASYSQPHYLSGIRIAAASNAMAGRGDAAREHIGRALRLDPGLRLSNLADRVGRIRTEYFASYAAALRLAGLPE